MLFIGKDTLPEMPLNKIMLSKTIDFSAHLKEIYCKMNISSPELIFNQETKEES
jgi:hypothetical protein